MGHTYTMRFHGMSLAIVIVANITYEEGKEKTKLLSWNFKTKCCKQFQYFHYSNKKTFLNRESSVASYVFTQARHFFSHKRPYPQSTQKNAHILQTKRNEQSIYHIVLCIRANAGREMARLSSCNSHVVQGMVVRTKCCVQRSVLWCIEKPMVQSV